MARIGDFAEGATWWDPTFQKRVASRLEVPAVRNEAIALLARMQKPGRPWVWKDPALCHFLPFWLPLWGDVAYIVTVRHPIDVARSWQRMAVPKHLWDEVDLTVCNLLRWQHMMLLVLRATDDAQHKIFVEFERLMEEPAREAARICAFLDQEFDGFPSEGRVASISEVVDRSLWRCRVDRPFEEAPEATAAQRALYRLLRAKAQDASAAFVDDFPMPTDWWRFVDESEEVVRNSA